MIVFSQLFYFPLLSLVDLKPVQIPLFTYCNRYHNCFSFNIWKTDSVQVLVDVTPESLWADFLI